MVRIPIIHIITILTISLGLSCTSELAVKTKAVDVDCSDLDAESAILSQCLARESARAAAPSLCSESPRPNRGWAPGTGDRVQGTGHRVHGAAWEVVGGEG